MTPDSVAAEAYQWRTFAFVPVELEDDFWPALEADKHWQPWHDSMNQAELEELRKFFVPEVASILCPGASSSGQHGRWYYEPADAAETTMIDMPQIRLGGVQLVRFPWLSAFIIEIFSTQSLGRKELLDTNRQAMRWIPKSLKDQLPLWRDVYGRNLTLAQWLAALLPQAQQAKLAQVFSRMDWFGHQLSSFSIVRSLHQAGPVQADGLTVSLLSAIPANEKGYRLAPAVAAHLTTDCVDQYWDDWFFAAHEGRYLAFLAGDAGGFIEDNLVHYYMPMLLLVIYQQLMAAQLLKQFHVCGLNENWSGLGSVRRQFTRFRHKFAFQYVTHYPLGNRIFSFAYRLADIDGQLGRIAEQIESVDNYEQLQIEKREAKTIILLAWMAALVLPVSTVAVIFALEQKLLASFYPFWLIALLSTLAMLSVVFIFQRSKRKARRGRN